MGTTVDGVELVLLPDAESGRFYGVTDGATVAWMAERLEGHPWACFAQPLRLEHEGALWALPQFHICCTDTVPARDPEMIASARAEHRLWEIDTGHDLMLTEPRAVADALLEIAARVGPSEA